MDHSGLNMPRVKRRLILGELDHVSGELTGPETGFDQHCVVDVAAWLNLERLVLMDDGLRS